MNPANPIVRRLDHIVVRTDAPEGLFSLFADALQLPVVRGVATHDFFTSGGVFAGNVYLEMMRFGRAKKTSTAQTAGAKVFGIAFEPYTNCSAQAGRGWSVSSRVKFKAWIFASPSKRPVGRLIEVCEELSHVPSGRSERADGFEDQRMRVICIS
jgi:hypothetical protein